LWSVNPPCKPLQLPPFAMWPAFPTSDYYGGSASLHIIGGTLPWHLCRPSPVHMPDSTYGRGCLSQSLSLRAASRCGHHGLAARSPLFPGSGIPVQRHSCRRAIHVPVGSPQPACKAVSAGVTFQPSDAFKQVRVPQPSHTQPRGSSWRNRFAASPVSHGLRHLASVGKSPPLRLTSSRSGGRAVIR
jgi:hypothetical protein